ncbi:MAG TPA: DUF4126 family protein [Mycobacterium sp.]
MMHMLVLLLALLIGAVAGLRALTAPAVVAWAAMLHWINLDGTWVQWLGHPITVAVLTVLALGELVTDQLPKTPSRLVPVQFITRLITGGFAGAALATAWGYPFGGLGAGLIGAVLGTLGGYQLRRKLSDREGLDLPVALTEDVVAVLGGFAIAALTATL